MPRKRERFERTDVPRYNPMRPYISIAVLVVIGIVLAIGLSKMWHKANQMNGLNDGDLDDALYEQLATHEPIDGYVESGDDFSNVVIFLVDDIHNSPQTLKGAQLLVRNTTQNTATVVNLPLNTKMYANESNVALQSYFESNGAGPTIAPLTDAANVHVSHVIVASERLYSQLENLEGPLLVTLMSSATDELETIASDYRTSELIGLADYLRGVGFSNITYVDAPYGEETFGDGSVVASIDRQGLCRMLGIFVEPEGGLPQPEEPQEGEGEEEWSEEGEWTEEWTEEESW